MYNTGIVTAAAATLSRLNEDEPKQPNADMVSKRVRPEPSNRVELID